VLVQGIDVYILDLGTDRVYKHLLNGARDGLQPMEGDQVLMRRGDQRGGAVVGELLDIAWVEAGGQRGSSNLLAIDAQGHVMEYDSMLGVQEFPAADSGAWREPVAVMGYYGRLYVLDPEANLVLKYVLTNSGYASQSSYLSHGPAPDLSSAVDLAIDGNLFILQSDGVILKYEEGAPVSFVQSNLDVPVADPKAFCATGFMDEDGYVYVADAGNQRIVQFSKAGDFVRQFRGTEEAPMDDLRSVFVLEDKRELYFINGHQLYLFKLPH
jgi:hypothetical protein